MNINDIVYLKSNKEKLMITWIVGVTINKNSPIDVNKLLMTRPDFQKGDIALKYNKNKKVTIPSKCLIDNLSNRIPAIDQIFNVGNVVKHKLTDKEMVITWIVGQIQESKMMDINKTYKMKGFQEGDIVCGFFEKREYKTELLKKGEVTKIFE